MFLLHKLDTKPRSTLTFKYVLIDIVWDLVAKCIQHGDSIIVELDQTNGVQLKVLPKGTHETMIRDEMISRIARKRGTGESVQLAPSIVFIRVR